MAFTPLGLRVATLLISLCIAVSATPLQLHPRNDFTHLGCRVDGGQPRALSGLLYANDHMTVDMCASHCTSFAYFGIEYGRECWCGNIIDISAGTAPQTDCSFQCPGNSAQTCGAGNRIDVYTNNAYTAPAHATLPGFPYVGCYVDNASRLLPNKIISGDDMTANKCAQNCAGYKYFGTQYGRECYCGNNAPPTTAVAPETDCSFICSGNPKELCGAGMRLGIYQSTDSSTTGTTSSTITISSTTTTSTTTTTSSTSMTSSSTAVATSVVSGYKYHGCWTDNVPQRILRGKSTADSGMTLQMCATACDGYAFFGVEYSRECYCGESLDDASQLVADTQCDMKCAGNNAQTCGAGNRLTIYQTESSIGAQNLATVEGFYYQQCWTDDVYNRALTGAAYSSDDMTVEQCATNCQGFSYFGVEWSRECYCGNSLLSGKAAPEADCGQLCVGAVKEFCGGPIRLNVYGATPLKISMTTSSAISTSTSTASTTTSSATSSTSATSTTTSSATSSTSATSTTTSSTTSTSSTSATSTTTSSTATTATTSQSCYPEFQLMYKSSGTQYDNLYAKASLFQGNDDRKFSTAPTSAAADWFALGPNNYLYLAMNDGSWQVANAFAPITGTWIVFNKYSQLGTSGYTSRGLLTCSRTTADTLTCNRDIMPNLYIWNGDSNNVQLVTGNIGGGDLHGVTLSIVNQRCMTTGPTLSSTLSSITTTTASTTSTTTSSTTSSTTTTTVTPTPSCYPEFQLMYKSSGTQYDNLYAKASLFQGNDDRKFSTATTSAAADWFALGPNNYLYLAMSDGSWQVANALMPYTGTWIVFNKYSQLGTSGYTSRGLLTCSRTTADTLTCNRDIMPNLYIWNGVSSNVQLIIGNVGGVDVHGVTLSIVNQRCMTTSPTL